MVRSFPAGALLFLQGGSSTFKARAAEGAPLLAIRPSYLVLDGQQRLTSLYQAMSGTGDARSFLDIGALLSGAEINDAVRVFSVARAMPFATLEAQARTMMMPLSAVRDGGAGRWRDDVVDLRADDDAPRVRRLLSDVERAFIDPLVQYAFPVTILPETTPLEAVCTIFETLNRTGKPLTPFELISARAFAGGHSLYDYWAAAKERHPIVSDFDIQPYYLLQIIALRLGLSCKHSSVLSLNPEDIARNWDAVVTDMAAVLTMLRDECGVLIARWLPYRPMLIPLAGAWRQVAGATGPAQGAMRAKLKRWFWCACFTGEYESSSASLAERDTPDLRDWLAGGNEPPVVRQFEWKPEQWRAVSIRQQGVYRATMALSLIGRPRDFHTGAPLTPELIELGKIDDHHVFPRGYLKDAGKVDPVDSVINHCLIDRATNIRIGKRAPSVYLKEIRGELGSELDQVLVSHHLPVGAESPLTTDDYEGFLAWRIDRLARALGELTGGLRRGPEGDPHRSELDARIESIELALRRLVVARLEGDPGRLPPHIAQKVDGRVSAATRRNPTLSLQHMDLLTRLEYCDLRELQDVITTKVLWPEFETYFRTKEGVSAKFAQFAELRNGIRHSRSVDEITRKEGEAAILWFERMLQDSRHRPSALTTGDGG